MWNIIADNPPTPTTLISATFLKVVILSGLIEIGLKHETSLSGLEIDPLGSDKRRVVSGDFTPAIFGDMGETGSGDWRFGD